MHHCISFIRNHLPKPHYLSNVAVQMVILAPCGRSRTTPPPHSQGHIMPSLWKSLVKNLEVAWPTVEIESKIGSESKGCQQSASLQQQIQSPAPEGNKPWSICETVYNPGHLGIIKLYRSELLWARVAGECLRYLILSELSKFTYTTSIIKQLLNRLKKKNDV